MWDKCAIPRQAQVKRLREFGPGFVRPLEHGAEVGEDDIACLGLDPLHIRRQLEVVERLQVHVQVPDEDLVCAVEPWLLVASLAGGGHVKGEVFEHIECKHALGGRVVDVRAFAQFDLGLRGKKKMKS